MTSHDDALGWSKMKLRLYSYRNKVNRRMQSCEKNHWPDRSILRATTCLGRGTTKGPLSCSELTKGIMRIAAPARNKAPAGDDFPQHRI
jgi:hypothetical protein